MAIPKIYWGLLNKRSKMAHEAELRSKIADIDKEIYSYFKTGRGKRTQTMTTKALREILGRCNIELTKNSIARLIREGKIPHKYDHNEEGGRYLFRRSDMEEWIIKLRKDGMEELRKRGLLAKQVRINYHKRIFEE